MQDSEQGSPDECDGMAPRRVTSGTWWDDPASDPLADVRAAMKEIENYPRAPLDSTGIVD